MLNRETLAGWIDELGLTHLKETILATLRPSIRITLSTVDSEDSIPVGASKFGGLPDLPSDFVWPQYGERPLSFVAQIRLEEATPYDDENLLPKTGLLTFFYDDQQWLEGEPFEKGRWHVTYYDGDVTQLRRIDFPANLENHFRYIRCHANFSSELTIPAADTYWGRKMDVAYEKADMNLRSKYFDLLDKLYEPGYTHRLLGHPDPIQGDVFVEAESAAISDNFVLGLHDKLYASPDSGIQDWLLLLQVDSEDDKTGMMWGDVGRLYYCIKQEALAARNFDQVVCTMQCT
jgi:uncharacterized protein YwqG